MESQGSLNCGGEKAVGEQCQNGAMWEGRGQLCQALQGEKKEPLVKESRQPSKARKGKKMNFPLEPLQRTPGPTDIFMFIQWDPFGLLTSRYESEYICIVLSYLVCGNLL